MDKELKDNKSIDKLTNKDLEIKSGEIKMDGEVNLFYNVKYNPEKWISDQKKTYDYEKENLVVKGFRKGHVPKEEMEKRLTKAYIVQKTINYSVLKVSQYIKNESEIKKPVDSDFFVEIQKADENELVIRYSFVKKPEIEIGTLDTLYVDIPPKIRVNEPDFKLHMHNIMRKYAKRKIKEGESIKGDLVNINFAGKIDGKDFVGGNASNFDLELGSFQFVKGFEDQLIGYKANDVVDVKIIFPSNYPIKDIQSKEATFKVKINSVFEIELPELNMEFITSLKIDTIKTVEDFQKAVKNDLLQNVDNRWKTIVTEKIINKVLSTILFSIPEKIYEPEILATKIFFENQAKKLNISLENFAIRNGLNPNLYNEQLASVAKNKVKLSLILRKYIEEKKYIIEEKEVRDAFESIRKQNDAGSMYNVSFEEFTNRYTYDKALGKITENIFNNSLKRQDDNNKTIIKNNKDYKEAKRSNTDSN